MSTHPEVDGTYICQSARKRPNYSSRLYTQQTTRTKKQEINTSIKTYPEVLAPKRPRRQSTPSLGTRRKKTRKRNGSFPSSIKCVHWGKKNKNYVYIDIKSERSLNCRTKWYRMFHAGPATPTEFWAFGVLPASLLPTCRNRRQGTVDQCQHNREERAFAHKGSGDNAESLIWLSLN